jgi:hypothetical protein
MLQLGTTTWLQQLDQENVIGCQNAKFGGANVLNPYPYLLSRVVAFGLSGKDRD